MPNREKPELSVNDLVKKIDEKLAEIEKEEQEAKKKKEQAKESKVSEAKIEPKTETKEINNITINNYNQKDDSKEKEEKIPRNTVSDYNKAERIESLDDDDDDDFLISNEELERKINDKLSSLSIEEEKEEPKIEKEEKEIKKEISDDYEPFVPTKEDEELIKSIENNLKQYKEEKQQEKDSQFKPTSAIKLDDISDDDKFFDDFFDD